MLRVTLLFILPLLTHPLCVNICVSSVLTHRFQQLEQVRFLAIRRARLTNKPELTITLKHDIYMKFLKNICMGKKVLYKLRINIDSRHMSAYWGSFD